MDKKMVTIHEDGKEISFRQFLEDQSGNGIIYDDSIQKILNHATADELEWVEVVDYLAPIAGELLSEAVQENKEVYQELVISMQMALDKLKKIRSF